MDLLVVSRRELKFAKNLPKPFVRVVENGSYTRRQETSQLYDVYVLIDTSVDCTVGHSASLAPCVEMRGSLLRIFAAGKLASRLYQRIAACVWDDLLKTFVSFSMQGEIIAISLIENEAAFLLVQKRLYCTTVVHVETYLVPGISRASISTWHVPHFVPSGITFWCRLMPEPACGSVPRVSYRYLLLIVLLLCRCLLIIQHAMPRWDRLDIRVLLQSCYPHDTRTVFSAAVRR